MSEQIELKENTLLLNKYFSFNVFLNTSDNQNILYTHWHDNIEIIYMVEGSAVFYIGNESYTVDPGEIIFVNRGLLHSGYSINNTQVVFYAIVFHPSLLASQSPDPFHSQFISPYATGQTPFPGKVELSSPSHASVKNLINSIIDEFEKKNPAYEIAIKAYLFLLVTQVIRDFPENQRITSITPLIEKNMDKLKSLISYVEDHYSEKITIEQASRLVNMSPFHFCKTFKKITGRTFIEFLNLYRVNEAEGLLRSTDYSVGEVAERVGFCNINYFDKVFKQYKRYSPMKCRK